MYFVFLPILQPSSHCSLCTYLSISLSRDPSLIPESLVWTQVFFDPWVLSLDFDILGLLSQGYIQIIGYPIMKTGRNVGQILPVNSIYTILPLATWNMLEAKIPSWWSIAFWDLFSWVGQLYTNPRLQGALLWSPSSHGAILISAHHSDIHFEFLFCF